MRFLCEQHRQHIIEQPGQALLFWQEWMNKSRDLIDGGKWQEATTFLGCSFELAEWLLNNPQPEQALRPIDRYMLAGHLLAECMGRNGRSDLELHFLLTVHLHLIDAVKTRQPHYWLLKHHLQISQTMLNRYRHHHGSFKGFYDCCVETELYIKQCIN